MHSNYSGGVGDMKRNSGETTVPKDKDSAKYKMHMALGLMFLTVFIDLVGFGIIIPLLPLYAKQFGANGLIVGLLLMSYSLMQFFFAPMWGRLSDKIGRRPVLLISLATSAIGYTIWGFADSLPMLFYLALWQGLETPTWLLRRLTSPMLRRRNIALRAWA